MLVAVVVGVLVGMVIAFPFALFNGWLLMLAIGIVHAHVLPAVQPVGYWTSVALALLLRLALSSSSNAKVERK